MTRFWKRGRLHYLPALASSAWADYYIDDTNTTLNYSSGPKAAWGPFAAGAETLELLLPNGTDQVIDAFVCYNHTYRYAACFDTDACLLTIPFTGSGVTVYVYQAGPVGINASITIDGGHAQTNVLSAPPAPGYEIANVSMFNVQQLQSGPHALTLLVNDFFGSYSGMMFDYAYVNESLVTNTTTANSTSPTATGTTPASTSASVPVPPPPALRNDIGTIVGVVVGGVALITICVTAFLWKRRRRARVSETITGSASPRFRSRIEHNAFVASAGNSGRCSEYTSPTNDAARDGSTDFITPVPLAPNRRNSPEVLRASSTLSSGLEDVVTPFIATGNPNDSKTFKAFVPSNTAREPTPQTAGRTSVSDSGPSQDAMLSLTDEEADLINSLHRNNVPAATLACMVERMLAVRRAGIGEWENDARLMRANTMTSAPPSYDG